MKIAAVTLLCVLAILAACTLTTPAADPITSFEECVDAGNPIMESYPRQCHADGMMFTEDMEQLASPPPDTTFTVCQERSEMCTREYRPVCGLQLKGIQCVTTPCPSVDAITKSNACQACADADVTGYYQGSCEENRFVICEEMFTGFNVTQMANENGWICTDVCPGNFDAYMTQIGAQMCIEHAGQEEIESWPVCERSTFSCDCVKAIETTGGQAIDDAQFRCVPAQYAERLLFGAGQERLDENGEHAVLIA